jgi:hypothetical protein
MARMENEFQRPDGWRFDVIVYNKETPPQITTRGIMPVPKQKDE